MDVFLNVFDVSVTLGEGAACVWRALRDGCFILKVAFASLGVALNHNVARFRVVPSSSSRSDYKERGDFLDFLALRAVSRALGVWAFGRFVSAGPDRRRLQGICLRCQPGCARSQKGQGCA